jgi:transposase
MAYSSDLRRKVLDFIVGGGSKAEASRRYAIGIATIYKWLSQPGTYQARKPGPKGGYKLDRDDLRAAIQAKPDSLQKELAQSLGVSVGAVAYAMKRMGYSRKKRHSTTNKV